MDLKIAARMIAVVAIGAGLTAAISALRHDNGPEDISPLHLRDPGGDPSLSVLARCRGWEWRRSKIPIAARPGPKPDAASLERIGWSVR